MITQTIIFSLSIIALILIWSKLWQKSLIDTSRDKLFDLRDDLRDHFLEENLNLEDPLYKNMRQLINTEIRYIEDIGIAKLAIMPNIDKNIEADFEKRFIHSNSDIQEYCELLREQSFYIIALHLITSSAFIIFAGFMYTLYAIVKSLLNSMSFTITNIKSRPIEWTESRLKPDIIAATM